MFLQSIDTVRGGRGFPVLEQNRERLKLFIERKTFGEFLASVALLIIISIKKTRCVKFIKSLISFLLLFVKIQKRMITFKSVTNIWFSCNIAQYNIYNDTNKVYSVTSVIMSQTLCYIIWLCPIVKAIWEQITVLLDETI